ncbi:hypothetical protein [Burkholderia contaminans]|uniref:hypothetical protein n=1 Tax=Burkholderia contaminans TaxID=488447 RepID=UPI00158AF08A|nr:hypothetical protein [Burkholderia contaminans]
MKNEIEIPETIDDLINQHILAKNNKDYRLADKLREELHELGWVEEGKPKWRPHLNICTDDSFDISKPYLHVGDIDHSHKHSIYCDGSYSINSSGSFCCVGGLIFDDTAYKVVGEFYRPLPTKDAEGNEFQPDFENQAIKVSIEVSEILKLRSSGLFADIYNDNAGAVKLHDGKYGKININVKLIPRYVNKADAIVSFARDTWKAQLDQDVFERDKKINQLFSLSSDNKIVITHNHMKKSRTQYYTAFNFETHEVIDSICLNEEPHLGEIKLATQILKNGLDKDVGFIFSNDTKYLLNVYRNHRSDAEELDEFFHTVASYNHQVAIENTKLDPVIYQKLQNYAQKSFTRLIRKGMD